MLRETVRQLKAETAQLRKENQRLRNELSNVVKPERERRPHVEEKRPVDVKEDFRQKFLKDVRPVIEKRIKERK